MNIDSIEKTFDEYTQEFDLSNYDIGYKYFHSYRVEHINNYLARKLNLSQEEIELATVIGLLHDIGRFKQLELFNNFDDDNINHADLGINILFDVELIKIFDIPKKYYDAIYFAIKNHNKYEIETCPYNDILYQTKLIRDSDKIDILDRCINYNEYPIKKDKSIISDTVKESFYQKRIIRKTERKTKSDAELLRMALLYDINFDESIELIKEKAIIENYYKLLKNEEMFIPYLDYLSEYVEKRSKSYVRKKV